MAQEAEITTMSKKGQVVIPQRIRRTLKIRPRTKFAVYARKNTIIMKAFEMPEIERELSEIFSIMDKKNLKLTEKDVHDEVQAYRANKRKQKKS
jgi:bifunctional DNA-binding transcriptional regulator/antitoxin component of YhaV-PrlF toxin-antitoxin module